MSGLYLVTLPIGNSEDITLRAINTLEKNSVIYCEDTRVFKELCKKIKLDYSDKSIRSYHDHSSDDLKNAVVEIAKDEGCAFVSDAGSPLISDPAFPLIQTAISHDIQIYSVGGISSVLVALELSGLPATPFHFHGFLSRDKGKIQAEFEGFSQMYGTHIFFEGKSRVLSTAKLLAEFFPNEDIVIARELTKEYESVYRFKGKDFLSIKDSIELRGEFVFLIHCSEKLGLGSSKELISLADDILKSGAKPKKVAKLIAQIKGISPKAAYEQMELSRQ